MIRFAVALAFALTPITGWAATDSHPPEHHSAHANTHVRSAPKPDAAASHGENAAKPHAAAAAKPHAAAAAKPHVAPAAKPAPVVAMPAVPAAPAAPAAPAEPPKGSNTGLPLPRFASLKTDEVNLRTGPGLRYPIDWVYKRRSLPVQIEREFEVWRLVADSEGVKGWVHQATLTGQRSFVVTGSEQVVRSSGTDTASPVARLKPGVVGRLRACDANAAWCQVQIGEYRGWLKRDAFWGTYPGEAVQ